MRDLSSAFTNGMETFWVAETLKYLWLLFGPDDVLDWRHFVLNTEAHPVRLANVSMLSAAQHAAATSR